MLLRPNRDHQDGIEVEFSIHQNLGVLLQCAFAQTQEYFSSLSSDVLSIEKVSGLMAAVYIMTVSMLSCHAGGWGGTCPLHSSSWRRHGGVDHVHTAG